MNLASFIYRHARANGNKIAIRCGDQALSYTQVASSMEAIAARLQDHGVGEGTRVALSMAEHAAHLVAHFSVARLGAVIVPVDHRWTAGEKLTAVKAFGVRVAIVDDAWEPGVTTLALGGCLPEPVNTTLPPVDEDDRDLLISLSSGTTGKPKGALVTHRILYERFISQWRTIGYGEQDCFAIPTPLFFGAGRSFAMCMLAAGGSVKIVPPPMKPPEVLAALADSEVTAAFLPPTMLRRLLPLHRAGDPPLLGNLRYLVASGEPLHAEEARRYLKRVCPRIFSYYASSEGGGISVLPPDDMARHADTVGLPTYRTEVEIVDSEDRILGIGQTGRLRYRGPGVASRYVTAEGVQQQAGVGGWFYPGDLAERQGSGHIALRGRDKDVIIRGGVNIYPAEIEACLIQHVQIREAAVVGIDDADHGQVVVAFIAGDVDIVGLAAWCQQQLAPYKIPERFERMDALPRTPSGKINKPLLRLNAPLGSPAAGAVRTPRP